MEFDLQALVTSWIQTLELQVVVISAVILMDNWCKSVNRAHILLCLIALIWHYNFCPEEKTFSINVGFN